MFIDVGASVHFKALQFLLELGSSVHKPSEPIRPWQISDFV